MKLRTSLLILMTTGFLSAGAQSYNQEINKWQDNYKQEFLKDEHSPLKAADTGFLRFYAANEDFQIKAKFTLTPDSKPFDIETHSGKKKPYRRYGVLTFTVKGQNCTLEVYQGLQLIKKPELKDHLFIPFTDLTSNETTFGGGRYLDFKTGDIKDNMLTIDFNKAYNPYCAFAEGYSCPIPPDANKLNVRIEAGELLFGKTIAE